MLIKDAHKLSPRIHINNLLLYFKTSLTEENKTD